MMSFIPQLNIGGDLLDLELEPFIVLHCKLGELDLNTTHSSL